MKQKSELPEGWENVSFEDILEINPAKPHIGMVPPDTPVTFIPMPAVDADAGSITAPEVRLFSEVRKGYTSFQNNDVVFAKITPCMENGKVAVARNMLNDLGFGSTEFIVFRSKGAISPDYLYHYIRQESYRKLAESNMTGSVGQKRVPKEFVQNSWIPLPPLSEQNRIVSAIAALFARLDATNEKLDRVPEILMKFKQSVLAAAFEGKLTEDWRKENPDIFEEISYKTNFRKDGNKDIELSIEAEDLPLLPSNWIWTKVNKLGANQVVKTGPFGSILKSKEFVAQGVPIIAIGNVQKGKIDLENAKVDHVTEEKAKELSPYLVAEGDVLFTRSGTIGRSAVVPKFADGWLMSYHLLRVRVDPEIISPNYLFSVFSGCKTTQKSTIDSIKGVTRPGINTTVLENLPIPLSPLPEQQEIVRRIDALFAFADSIEAKVAAARNKTEKLRQSILAKAFSGELVETEAEIARREGRDYETAEVLLERIKKEKGKNVKKTIDLTQF